MAERIPGEGGRGVDAAQCAELLNRLPGVYAANVRLDEGGEPLEIHILAGCARHPKQIGRDVQSALFAAFGLWVDHRIISIAQISGDPIRDESAPLVNAVSAARLKYKGISSTVTGEGFAVRVTLGQDEADYVGEASCKNTPQQRTRAVARATLDAVHQFLGCEDMFALIASQAVQVGGWQILATIIEFTDGAASHLLVGAAQFGESDAVTAVRSTLDALNRLFCKLAAERQ